VALASAMMDESLAGQLLLASPSLRDPNFERSVVLIGVHSAEGAMGIVLNRPSDLTVGEAAPQLEEAVSGSERVYVGGPVQRRAHAQGRKLRAGSANAA
jgi:putative transcriptional regulator